MSNIPLPVLGLDVPNMTFQNGNNRVSRPITDHPPIIQNTLWGAIGTINILNPGSKIAPPAQIDGVKMLPVNGQVQMELMAEYIFKLFQQGLALLALQEVPDPRSANFHFLSDKLKSLVGNSKLIDVDVLSTQWLKTGTHRFGTSMLCNPSQFHISINAAPALNNRAAVCEVTSANGQTIPVANMHGDFNKQAATANYVADFKGFCLGDLNITHSTFAPVQDVYSVQSIERPILQIEGNSCLINTVDFIQDTYSKRFNPFFIADVERIAQRKNVVRFSIEKMKIQQQFIHELNVLDNKISAYAQKDSASDSKGKELYQTLYAAQELFFAKLTPDASSECIHEHIADFRTLCAQNIREADRVMGHGWLYRIGEVLLKAVAGLYAGIGMVLGALGGHGLANPQHRQAYRDSFLTLNQSAGSNVLQEFKQITLGTDEYDQGLLDEVKLTPKNR